jgi:ABC-type transport system involved in multi-copper enzyme maturation permease subunit
MIIVSLIGIFVTFICCILSGIISFVVAKITVKNQQKLNDINQIIKLIDNLISSSTIYWLSPGRDEIVESKLTHKLQRLNVETNSVFAKEKSYLEDLQKTIISFRREITGGSFGSQNKQTENGRVNQISEVGVDLIGKIKNKIK